MEAQIDSAIIEDEPTRQKVLQQLQKREAQLELHRKLRRVGKRRTTGAIKYIKVPYLTDPQDPNHQSPVYYPKFLPQTVQNTLQWKDEYDPQEMARILIERNRRHYSQAEGTPFTIDTLLHTFGRSACTPLADMFLAGTHEIQHVSPAVQDVLNALQHDHLPQVSATFTSSELQQAFRTWRESTSTSPSGLHLGHYRALLPLAPWESQPAQDEDISSLFYESLAIRLQVATKLGYYRRWEKVITCVIEESYIYWRLMQIVSLECSGPDD